MERVNVGIIGCGNISDIYLKNLTTLYDNVNVLAVSDMNPEAAREQAKKYGIKKACTDNEELLAMREIEIVLILTNPASHAELCKAALRAGKNVYTEKPLATNLSEADELIGIAKEKGLLVGCAPDTVLGAGVQTCKKLIADGWVGTPIGVRFQNIAVGPEVWHPNPAPFYSAGAGPVLDIGPYYVTCMVYLLGAVKRVASLGRTSRNQVLVTSTPHFGESVSPEVHTYVSGLLEFESGVIGSGTLSWDGNSAADAGVEIVGTEGTIVVPNPDCFGGKTDAIKYKRTEKRELNGYDPEWAQLPVLFSHSGNCRGLGVAEMAAGLRMGRRSRLNGEMARHVLEILLALANPDKNFVEIQSRFVPMPAMDFSTLPGMLR